MNYTENHMLELVSVIIPAYNVGKYIDKCLKSVTAQTYRNLEVIIVDDGSTDDTYEKCVNIANNDGRVKIFRQNNKGVSAARNYGLGMAAGKYICFVDADDCISPLYVEIMLRNLVETDSDISLVQYTRQLPLDSLVDEKKKEIWSYRDALIKSLNIENPVGCIYCKMYKMQMLRDLKFDENIRIAEDKYFFYTVLARCNRIVYQDINLYYYYERTGSAMKSAFDSRQLDRKLVNRKLYDLWSNQYPDLEPLFMKNLVMSSARCIQESLGDNTSEATELREIFMEDIRKCKYSSIKKICNKKECMLLLIEKNCLWVLKLYETLKIFKKHIFR